MIENQSSTRFFRVATLVAPKTIELRTEEIPSAPPGGIVVRIRAALTDGTDLKTYRRGHPKMPMPTRFGHEFSGDVVTTGEGVTTFVAGDSIMSVHTAPCGTCFWCTHDQEELCETLMPTMILGAYADYIVIPERILKRNTYAKPDNLSYIEAAFLEPLACVVHSVEYLFAANAQLHKDSPVIAVIGNGAFGILHAQVLREYGATPLLIGRNKERSAIAQALGIDVINSAATDPLQAIASRTEGRGADAVIECTGNPDVWQEAPLLVRRGGTVSFFGGLPASTQVAFQASRIHYDEIRLIGPFHLTPKSVRQAFELLCDRKINVTPLVTQTYPLDAVAEVFERLDRGEGLKYAIEP